MDNSGLIQNIMTEPTMTEDKPLKNKFEAWVSKKYKMSYEELKQQLWQNYTKNPQGLLQVFQEYQKLQK
jgi:hypothetical protein